MTTLHQLLAPRAEATFVHERIGELMIQDRLPAEEAGRIVRQRIAEGDSLLLADVGQEWTLRPEYSPGQWTGGRRLQIVRRLAEPPAVVVLDTAGGEWELSLPLLGELYELTNWRWRPFTGEQPKLFGPDPARDQP
ncbi:hypothetical protein DR950_41875 [Kitasatospora xanthocidica]|uniref:Uncharacterized protein n=1 Tax=Kitasatospora xanthocidica TaxID=83382 RepID=A0A372ZJJ9_9ACTN|nr:hypothetical protein [Kitasatospora xanthocidica]RGD55415.1 hypothetical protein DR950_41875 [Kitasatospora xanthocidica]